MPTTPRSACAVTLCLLMSGCSTFFPVFEQVSVEGDGLEDMSKDGAVLDQAMDGPSPDTRKEECTVMLTSGQVVNYWDFSQGDTAGKLDGWMNTSQWKLSSDPKDRYFGIHKTACTVGCEANTPTANMPFLKVGSAVASLLIRVTYQNTIDTLGYLGKITATNISTSTSTKLGKGSGVSELILDCKTSGLIAVQFMLMQSGADSDEDPSKSWKIKKVEMIPICATN